MTQVFQRQAGVGSTGDVYIQIRQAGSTDFAGSGDWTPAAGDVKISIDGGTAANIATLPTFVDGAGWKFTFSDAELSGLIIGVQIVDSATKAIEDTSFVIETSQLDFRFFIDEFDTIERRLSDIEDRISSHTKTSFSFTAADHAATQKRVDPGAAAGSFTPSSPLTVPDLVEPGTDMRFEALYWQSDPQVSDFHIVFNSTDWTQTNANKIQQSGAFIEIETDYFDSDGDLIDSEKETLFFKDAVFSFSGLDLGFVALWNNLPRSFTRRLPSSGSCSGSITFVVPEGESIRTVTDRTNLIAGTIGGAVQYVEGGTDTGVGSPGSISNPAISLSQAVSLAGVVNVINVLPPSGPITLTTAVQDMKIIGVGQIDLGDVALDGLKLDGLQITGGTATAATTPAKFNNVEITGSCTLPQGDHTDIRPGNVTVSFNPGDTSIEGFGETSPGTGTVNVNLGTSAGDRDVSIHDGRGACNVQNLGAASRADTLVISGDMKVTLEASCVGGTLRVLGAVEVDSSASSGVTIDRGAQNAHQLTAESIETQVADVYLASIHLDRDTDNTQDEYTVIFTKNAIPVTTGITNAQIQVVKRADGTNLVAATNMTQIGTTGAYKHDETTGRITPGEAVVVTVTATIDSATRTVKAIIGRDS